MKIFLYTPSTVKVVKARTIWRGENRGHERNTQSVNRKVKSNCVVLFIFTEYKETFTPIGRQADIPLFTYITH